MNGITVFFSAPGSPGGTFTSLIIAAATSRACLWIDADVTISQTLAILNQGAHDSTKDNLATLALAHQRGHASETLRIHQQCLPHTTVKAIGGPGNPGQVNQVESYLPHLVSTCLGSSSLAAHVLVDAGRIGTTPITTYSGASNYVVVLTSTLPSILRAAPWVTFLQDQHRRGIIPPVSLVVREEPRDNYSSKQIETALGVPVLARIPFSPKGITAFKEEGITHKKCRNLANVAQDAANSLWQNDLLGTP